MAEQQLHWSEAIREGMLVAAPRGRVDEATAQQFADSLNAAIDRMEDAIEPCVVIDLSGIDYMSSRGLRALTLAQRRAADKQVRLSLAEPGGMMQEILQISRFDKLFEIYPTIDSALTGA